MSVVRYQIALNFRAAIWIRKLAEDQGVRTDVYIQSVLLRHLLDKPEIDLSRSPYSEPQGGSNGKGNGEDGI